MVGLFEWVFFGMTTMPVVGYGSYVRSHLGQFAIIVFIVIIVIVVPD